MFGVPHTARTFCVDVSSSSRTAKPESTTYIIPGWNLETIIFSILLNVIVLTS